MENQKKKESFKSLVLRWYANHKNRTENDILLAERDNKIADAIASINESYADCANIKVRLDKEKASIEVLIRRYARLKLSLTDGLDRQLLQGLGVKKVTEYVYDVKQAVKWCAEKGYLNMLGLANTKAFEAIAENHLLGANSFVQKLDNDTTYFEAKTMVKFEEVNLKNLDEKSQWFEQNETSKTLPERLTENINNFLEDWLEVAKENKKINKQTECSQLTTNTQ